MKRLLVNHGQFSYPSRGLVGKSSVMPAICNNVIPRFLSTEKDENTLTEIGDKARSTAEQFLRVAKEIGDKTDDVSESAKETSHETKEAVVGESDNEKKEKFKQRVEEGRYHQN